MNSLLNVAPRDEPQFVLFGPPPDVATSPSLTANFVCRVLFALIGNLICVVPLRLLYRNGELAAALFILVVQLQNFEYIVNALIWHNDDVESWWPGYGLCDVNSHVRNLTIGLFNGCLLAIMRNLSLQIGNMRASPLTKKEKTRRNIVQAIIIFPLPLLQVVWTYPLAEQRYYIGTLVGCTWANAESWPYVIFYVVLPTMMPFITAGYAIFVYIQYRKVSKATATALSNSPLAQARSQRARRRLYLMVVSILVPYVPIAGGMAVMNGLVAGHLKPFDFNAIHNHAPNEPTWNTIVYLTSNHINWSFMNSCYLPIATTIPIFVFFGMTKDAMNCYRVVLLFLGLGKVFPRLHQEYDPDARMLASMSHGSHSTSTSSYRKNATRLDLSSMTSIPSNQITPTLQQPAPAATSLPVHNQDVNVQPIRRNPFLFNTHLNFSLPFKLSLFRRSEDNASSAPLELLSYQPTNRSVWSDEEPLPVSGEASATVSSPQHTSSFNNQGDKDKDHSVIAPAPPVVLPPSTSRPVNSYGEL